MLKNNHNNCSLIFIFLSYLLLIIPYIKSNQIEIPLKLINTSFTKYPTPKTIFIKKNSLLNINCLNNYEYSFLSDSQNTLSVNLDILFSLLFAVEVEIGSNNQKFNLIMDTGSQILWVPEVYSSNTNKNIENFYNPKSSKTSKKTNQEFEVFYGTGYCLGYYYQDTINFLSKEKYYMLFGSANYSVFEVDGSDGIMGLAKSYPNYLLSPLLILKKKGILKSTSFSFRYDNKNEQLFFYAGTPHSDFNKKNVAFCNLLSNSNYEKMLWACQLKTFGLIKNISNITGDDNIIADADISVILDTGTNVILLPYYIILSIEEKLRKFNCVIGSTSKDDFGSESSFIVCFDIYNIPDISLQFGDYILILNKYRMFFAVNLELGIKGYVLNVHFQKSLGVAIIGQNFFTEFHTLFDSENNVLKFYSDYKNKIINLKDKNSINDNPDDDKGISFGNLFIFFMIIIFVLVYLYYRNKKKKIAENENQFEWMGQNNNINYKYNNIYRNDYNAMS